MTIYSIPPLFGTFVFLFLGLFVYGSSPKTRVKKIFSIICLETFCWQILWFISFFISDPNQISIIAKIAYIPITFLPFTFYHFIVSFLEQERRDKSVIYFYILGLFLVSLIFPTNLYVSGHHDYSWGHFASAGRLYPFFMVSAIGALIRGVTLLLKKAKTERSYKNSVNQTKYMLLAMFFYALCAVDFPQVYGANWYPIGSLFFLISFAIVSYAITMHQLLDIEVVVRRTAVFAGLFTFVYSVFTVVTLIGQEFFKNILGWNEWLSLIPTVIIITLALRPLENYLTNITEKFLFQKKYDYRELLKTFTNEVLTVLDLQQLPNQTASGLNRIMKLESVAVLLQDKDTKIYKMVASIGVKEKELSFKSDDAIITYLKASHQHILKDKEAENIEGEGVLKAQFKQLGAQLCLPISLHDDLIGVLCLGRKKSGEDYTQEDIDILNALARTEAIAISNAQLFDELSKTQAEAAQREKMAVIGTLAAGINHEICNPLGIVRGQCEMFLLNQRDGLYKEKTPEEIAKICSEIMAKVIKETDRATAITKKLSGFAKPSKRSEMEEVMVEKEVDEVLSLIGHDLKLSNIEIQQDFPKDFPVILADKKQIQEVLFNIIRNAAQAIDKKQGRIVVSGFSDNGSAVIRIADNGSGIPADKLGQIFNPFYTTKAPGKGTGLGLFIVKQVVERNKGQIAVESEAGVGTTFTLRFPSALKLVAMN